MSLTFAWFCFHFLPATPARYSVGEPASRTANVTT